MRLKVEVSAPSAEIQQDVCERTKKNTEWLQKCWCQEGRKDRVKRECDEMMNLLAVGMQWLASPCSETTPPPYGSSENFKHMPSAAAFCSA